MLRNKKCEHEKRLSHLKNSGGGLLVNLRGFCFNNYNCHLKGNGSENKKTVGHQGTSPLSRYLPALFSKNAFATGGKSA